MVFHRLGVHPDFGMIGAVRTDLAEAGYVTLSVQMPVLATGATRDDYAVAAAGGARTDRGRYRVSAREGHPKDRDRFAQRRSDDGRCLSRAAGTPRLSTRGCDRHAVDFASPFADPVQDIVAETIPGSRWLAPPARNGSRDRLLAPTHVKGADHYFERRQKELAASISPHSLVRVTSATV